jgi:ABC-type multidrug transport system ATPase subunit
MTRLLLLTTSLSLSLLCFSGKSTTLKLITRMLEPTSGEILIDGVNVKEVTIESLRRRIAVVPQDTCLFDETIDYNIRYGKSNATEEEIREAIAKSNLESTIEKFPLGLETNVGERGARLSGGERQKVSIARAILKNPSLILCDEVTSSVDAFAEKDIIDTLRSATAERTTVTVAHRLSSIAHSDLIIVMEKGEIVEIGTHSELLQEENNINNNNRNNRGIYRKMWQAQNEIAINEGKQEQQLHKKKIRESQQLLFSRGAKGKEKEEKNRLIEEEDEEEEDQEAKGENRQQLGEEEEEEEEFISLSPQAAVHDLVQVPPLPPLPPSIEEDEHPLHSSSSSSADHLSLDPSAVNKERERRRRNPRVVRDMQDMNEDYEFNELEEKVHEKSKRF